MQYALICNLQRVFGASLDKDKVTGDQVLQKNINKILRRA